MKHAILGLLIFCVTHSSQLWADIQVQGYLNQAAMENLASAPTCAPAATCPLGRIYWDTTANEPRIWDGSVWQEMLVGAAAVPDPLQLGPGGAGSPTYSFADDTDTGIYLRTVPGEIGIAVDGSDSFRCGSALCLTNIEHSFQGNSVKITEAEGIVINTNNVTDNIEIEFIGTESGEIHATATAGQDLYLAADDRIYLRPGNTPGIDTIFEDNGQILAENGSATSPTFSFNGDSNTGLYRKSTNTMGLAQSAVLDSNELGYGGTEVDANRLDINLNSNAFDAIGLISQGMNTTSQFTPALYFGTDDTDLSCPVEKGCPLAAIIGEAENTYNGSVARMSLTFLTKDGFTANNDAYRRVLRITSGGQLRAQTVNSGVSTPQYSFGGDTDTGMYTGNNAFGNHVGIGFGSSDGMRYYGSTSQGLEVRIGSSANNVALCSSGINTTSSGMFFVRRCSSSSREVKNNITDIPEDYSVDGLRPVRFFYNEDEGPTDVQQEGFIAEEVAETHPLLAEFDEDGKAVNVKKKDMTALLVHEIQKLKARVAELEAKQ